MATVTFPVALGGDGSTVTDDRDPTTGLRGGGYQTRYVPTLSNTVAIGQRVVEVSQSILNDPDTYATSTTSLLIGTGSKVFTIQTGKNFAIGQFVIAASAADATNYMIGQVTAHDNLTGSLTLNVSVTNGSGTLADWVLSVTARPGVSSGWQLVSTATASTSATLDFTNLDGTTYDYMLVGEISGPSVASALQLRVSIDNGATFPSTLYQNTLTLGTGSGSLSAISLTGTVSANGQYKNIFSVLLNNLASTGNFYKPIRCHASYLDSGGAVIGQSLASGLYQGSFSAINAVRLLYASGNIVSGQVRLYRIARS